MFWLLILTWPVECGLKRALDGFIDIPGDSVTLSPEEGLGYMRYQDADLAIRTQLSDHLMVALLGLIYSLIAAREPQFYFLPFSLLLGSIFSPI